MYDCFADRAEWTLPALKSEAGFAGASREFEAALTELQGLFFLCISGQDAPRRPDGGALRLAQQRLLPPGGALSRGAGRAMRTVEAEEYLLDCVQRAGDFPLRAVRRLLCGGGISSA